MVLHEHLFGRIVDHRTDNWLLMSSAGYSVAVGVLYVICVKIIGPKLMENRKPYEFKNTLVWYNAYQVLASIYIFYELSSNGWLTNYNWLGQSIDYSDSPSNNRILNVSYLYHLSRYTELLDTFFFVARKKYNQVTVLHVSHHAVMPLFSYIGTKYGGGGSGTFPSFANSFIHIIMYTYYMFAAMGPHYQKYLWWKKYITVLQLVQFVVCFLHSLSALLIVENNVPRICLYTYIGASVYFFALFYTFYKSSYNAKHLTHGTSNGLSEKIK